MVDVEADEVDVTGADSVDVTLTFNVRWRELRGDWLRSTVLNNRNFG